MMQMQRRLFSNSAALLKKPRMIVTFLETAKDVPKVSVPIVKPFGYDTMVNLAVKEDSIFNMFSAESRERRQKQIDFDILHSPFYDFKGFHNTKGKVFRPPISYFKREKSKYFPNIAGTTLAGDYKTLDQLLKGKVTLLRVYTSIQGEKCVNSYVEDYLSQQGYDEFLKKYPRAQIVDLNVAQSWIKGLFVSFAKSNLRKLVPPLRQGKYFMLPNKMFSQQVRRNLQCENEVAGYLYLLDDEGRIRWASSGFTDEKESEVLWRAVKGIEKEIDQNETDSHEDEPVETKNASQD